MKASEWKIVGKSDAEDFNEIVRSFEVLAFTDKERSGVFEVLASVLQIGNVEYTSSGDTSQVWFAHSVLSDMSHREKPRTHFILTIFA